MGKRTEEGREFRVESSGLTGIELIFQGRKLSFRNES